ncbi:MAG: hypothetical protein WCP34_14710, partial [Pseudomonadota bacterium]
VVISTATLICTVPSGATPGLEGKGKISEVSGQAITYKTSKGVSVNVTVSPCAKIEWNDGAKSFSLGQMFEWHGYKSTRTGNVAQSVVIN